MRKGLFFLTMALLPLLSACQREVLDMADPVPGRSEVEITATLGDATTRTQLGTDTKVYWSPGDAISIFSAGEHERFVAQNTEPVKIAKFKGRISVITGASDGTAKDYIWGFYPYSQDNVYSEPEGVSETATITATLPSEQTAVPGTFNDGYAMAIGRSETLGISFQNLYSGFWFTLTNRNDIHSVTLSSDQPLAGRFTAGLDASGTPEIKEVVEGSNSITLTAPDGGTFERGKAYYFVLFPGTYNLTVTARTSTLEGSREIRNLTLQRNNLAVGSKSLDEKITSSGTGFDYILPAANEIWIETDQDDEWAVLPSVLPDGVTVENAERRDDGVIVLTFSEALPAVLPDCFFSYYPDQSGSSTNDSAKSLLSIALPAQVTTIGNLAFQGCSEMSSISMGDVTHIGALAFSDCWNLGEITLPETLTNLGEWAFARCSALRSVRIPASLGTMGSNPFIECSSLESFEGKYASSDHRYMSAADIMWSFAPAGLTEYTVPSGIKILSSFLFKGCEELTSLTLPEGLTIIGDGVFEGCRGLTEITVPSTVTSVGDYIFSNCVLEKIYFLPESVPAAVGGKGAFQMGSSPVVYVPASLLQTYKTTDPWLEFADCYRPYHTATDYMILTPNNYISSYWESSIMKLTAAVPGNGATDPSLCVFNNDLNAGFSLPNVEVLFGFSYSMAGTRTVGSLSAEFSVSADKKTLIASIDGGSLMETVATLDDAGVITLNRSSSVAEQLMNTGEFEVLISATGNGLPMVFWDDEEFFKARFVRPVNTNGGYANGSFSGDASRIDLEHLLDLKDWREKSFLDNSNFWSYYGPFTVTVDTAHVQWDANGSRTALPSTIRVSQSGTSVDGTGSSLLSYRNNATLINRTFSLYIPVTVNYRWGSFTDEIQIYVYAE